MSLFKFKKEKINFEQNIQEIQNKLEGKIFKGYEALKLPKGLVLIVVSSPNKTNDEEIIKTTGQEDYPFICLYTKKLDKIGEYWGSSVLGYSFKVLALEEVNNL